jgi:N-acetyl-anhydromuramyl-L-alanine amidase AmpD
VRRAALVLVAALLLPVAGAGARNSGELRRQPIDMVVIHSTGGPTCDAHTGKPVWIGAGKLEDDLRSIEAHPTLGIHYMIGRDGTVRSSVPENRIAWHVFRFSERSVAIELVNDGDGRDVFPPAQLDALVSLLRDVVRRNRIPRSGIRRHSDLDHGMMSCDRSRRRKVDPGAAFPFDAVVERVYGTAEVP